MDNSGCPGFNGCKAPLCPMDESFVNGAIWYVDEDICMAKKYRKERWRVVQRKIKKLNERWGVKGYFTKDNLLEIHRIGKGLKGKHPENSRD